MDWSINLPTWAYQEGYRLEGRRGTYDDLELYKNFRLIRKFGYNKIPNIIEIEEVIDGIESQEAE